MPDDLLKRALDVTIEDIQDYVGGRGYRNQFESGWQALHIDQPFAGRAVTAQFMPTRADMVSAIQAEGKAEGRVGTGTNTWVINELVMGDTLVADGFGKIVGGTLIGSNLGSGIAAKNPFRFHIRRRHQGSGGKPGNPFSQWVLSRLRSWGLV